MEFDKELLIQNIDYLCEDEKIKKTELETDIGASNGYLTRISKKDNDTKPNIDLICKIADRFGIDVNSLLFCNYVTIDKDSQLSKRFLSKLIDDTDEGDLEWKIEEPKSYLRVEAKTINGIYPLYKVGNEQTKDKYKSLFFPNDYIRLADVMYRVQSSDLKNLYIIKVLDESDIPFYEMYSIDIENIETFDQYGSAISGLQCSQCFPLLHTRGNNNLYITMLNSLLKLIISQNNGQRMSKETKNFMQHYLDSALPFNF